MELMNYTFKNSNIRILEMDGGPWLAGPEDGGAL